MAKSKLRAEAASKLAVNKAAVRPSSNSTKPVRPVKNLMQAAVIRLKNKSKFHPAKPPKGGFVSPPTGAHPIGKGPGHKFPLGGFPIKPPKGRPGGVSKPPKGGFPKPPHGATPIKHGQKWD